MAALEWILATLVAAWPSYLTYAATRGSGRASLAAARQAMLTTQAEVEHVGSGTPSLIVLHDPGGVVLRNQKSQVAVGIVCWIGRAARETALEHLDPGQQSPLRAGPADVVLASCYHFDKRRYVAVYDPLADGARHPRRLGAGCRVSCGECLGRRPWKPRSCRFSRPSSIRSDRTSWASTAGSRSERNARKPPRPWEAFARWGMVWGGS